MIDLTECLMNSKVAIITLDKWLKRSNNYKFIRFCIKEIITTKNNEYKQKVLKVLYLYFNKSKKISSLSAEEFEEIVNFVNKYIKQNYPLD